MVTLDEVIAYVTRSVAEATAGRQNLGGARRDSVRDPATCTRESAGHGPVMRRARTACGPQQTADG